MKLRSMYASDWRDENFPEWEQFTELNAKRPYYHNRATGEVSWAPPSEPDLDIFKKEAEEQEISLTAVPDGSRNGDLFRRTAACVVDVGISIAAGCAFGLCVYIDLGNATAAVPAVGFTSWLAFIGTYLVQYVWRLDGVGMGRRILELYSVVVCLSKNRLARIDGEICEASSGLSGFEGWKRRFRCSACRVYVSVHSAVV